MTGAEHRRKAERLLAEAEALQRSPHSADSRRRTTQGIAEIRAELLARAQVHATLSIEPAS